MKKSQTENSAVSLDEKSLKKQSHKAFNEMADKYEETKSFEESKVLLLKFVGTSRVIELGNLERILINYITSHNTMKQYKEYAKEISLHAQAKVEAEGFGLLREGFAIKSSCGGSTRGGLHAK